MNYKQKEQAKEFDIKWRKLSTGENMILVGVFGLLLLSPFISIAIN